MIYNYPREAGVVYDLVFAACYKALYKRTQLILVPNQKAKKKYSDLVLQIMNGAWPIRLKIKTTDELINDYKE